MRTSGVRMTVITILMFVLCVAAKPVSAEVGNISGESPHRFLTEVPTSREDDPFSEISFPTVYKSGFDACTNGNGLPVILLFSRPSCSHCEWVGDVFDIIATYYMASGQIEAHHYDVETGDDLLTKEVETQIPSAFLQLKERGDPKDVVPYFNFSCKYERIGNGYGKTDDIAAEGEEIRKVIETLIQVLSTPERKK